MADDILFAVTDPLGQTIRLSRRQYEEHIVKGHQEVDDPELIRAAVEHPDSIWRETRHAHVTVYYRQGAHPRYRRLFLCVVVRAGQVVTTHLIDQPRCRRQVQIWTS